MQALFKVTPVKLMFLVLAAVVWFGVPVAQAQTGPQGMWLDQTGKAGILIAPCGTQLCGKIEWLRDPLSPQNTPKTDIHNPDASLQSRPICGLSMLGAFVPDGSGGWDGGWIYDPESGKTYKAVMHLAADGTLKMHGYIGIPMLGRTEIWTRPPAALPQCTLSP